MRDIPVLIRKEILQFRRNPFLSRILFAFPVMIMLVIPWVTTMDVKHVGVAVVDGDASSLSRDILSRLEHSTYFTLQSVSQDYRRELKRLEDGDVDVILSIPDGYEKSIIGGVPGKISISANAVNATKGSLGAQYLAGETALAIRAFCRFHGMAVPEESITVRNQYNETLQYRNFMIPALIIILLLLIGGFVPALNIVSEKEKGTIEQINVTPVRPISFILAKLIPYWVIGFIDITIAMAVAALVYGLIPLGSLGAIYLAALLFVVIMSAFGVIAANITNSMVQTIFVMFFFVIIFMLMGGLLTPVGSMPHWAQCVTYLLPPRYFGIILRSVYLKGATIADLWLDYAALLLLASLFVTGAALTYRKQQ